MHFCNNNNISQIDPPVDASLIALISQPRVKTRFVRTGHILMHGILYDNFDDLDFDFENVYNA